MSRKHNFNAGPSTLPLPVLEEAAANLVDTKGLGLSVLEMSHRSKEFGEILKRAKESLAELLALPADYEILFIQGGASQQFAMVPLNLGSGAYLTTGIWSKKALAEARIVGGSTELWSDEKGGFRRVPRQDEIPALPTDAAYLHYTTNNTIVGTQYPEVPPADRPLVADMSSDFLSAPMDLKPFGLIYAGAQKNAGSAGITIVVGRRSILERFEGPASTPKIFRYQAHLEAGSLYNTIPTFSLYLCSLVFEWILREGGLVEMAKRAKERAERIYGVIDQRPELFQGHAEPASRSRMNLTFRLPSKELEERFLERARAAGCVGLSGHRSVGGLRASLYNAQPMAAVEALAKVMESL